MKSKKLNNKTIQDAIQHLKKVDRDLKELISQRKDIIKPFHREVGFEGLANLIVEQQLSVASAKAIFSRVRDIVKPFAPDNFLLMSEKKLRETGLSRQKINYLRGIASKIKSKEINLQDLNKLTDQEVIEELVQVKGIGYWTANCYLIACMRRIDAWPSSDLGLLISIQKLKGLKERPKSLTIEKIAEPWRPYRSVAALLLWSSYD
tara:strand:+ start:33973 stop:34590 length:618 start_codon:yes stop_codon:yes gene_type:complete